MKKIFIALLSVILSGTLLAEISEKAVTVARGVEGKFVLPGDDQPDPNRVVMLFHGWTGNMDEVGDLYKRLAHQLGEAGIASLRIDFRGEGERNGHRLTSTFATRIADGEAALTFVQKAMPRAKVGVVGFSLGGATALAVAGKHPTEITSLVLWSSSGNLAVDFFGDSNAIGGQREAIEKGEATFQSWADLTITREHLMGFIGYDLLGPMKAYQGALLAVRGSDDFLARYEDKFLEAASGWREEYLIMSGTDHIFHALDPESLHDDRLIAATRQFLQETL